MNSLNKILLEGNLTRDPETRETPRGTHLCVFSVASNRYYRTDATSQQEVSFFDVEVWGSVADRCSAELKKGRGVRITGRLKQERWTDKSGQSRSRVKIVGESVEIKYQFQGRTQTRDASEKFHLDDEELEAV